MDFAAKRAARIERLGDRADRLRREGNAAITAGDQALSHIPLGQPILVGHHSETRDRNYRRRATDKISKGVALLDEAKRAERRAQAAAENTAIFSDDPAAQDKLAERITQLEARQARMVAANKCVKKDDREGLADLGFSPKAIDGLFTPDFCGRTGFPGYMLSNNSANLRRLKERVTTIERQQARETVEYPLGAARVVENAEANRFQLFFPGKPADDVRARLKSYGFRWSPSEGAWQRHLGAGNGAKYAAQQALGLPVSA